MDKSSASPHPRTRATAAASGESALLRGVSQAGSTLHETIDKVVEPARSTVDRAAAVAHHTVDQLASGASSVAGKVADQTHRLTDAPLQAVDYSKAYIKDHPLQAVGAALLVGLLVGRLTARSY